MTTIAGRYEIESEIGRGGMGVVYLAADTTIGRKVALKKLSIDSRDSESDDAVKRFMREARLTGQLHHPDIVTLFDVVEEAGELYLVLEYYPSRSLADVVEEEGPLAEDRARQIGASVAAALEAAHAAGVIHRDVKPENILVGERGAKLTDFGIARISEAGSDAGSRITKTGFYMGTVGYMAPEQIAEHDATGASDVFAAGGALYFCLTGEDPFGEGVLPAVLYRIVNLEPDYSRLHVSDDLRVIISTAMSKDPLRRPAAGGLKAALEGSAESLGIELPPVATASQASVSVAAAPGSPYSVAATPGSPYWDPSNEPLGPNQLAGYQSTPSWGYSGDTAYPPPSISQDQPLVGYESGVVKASVKRSPGRALVLVTLILLLLVAAGAIWAGVKSANRQDPGPRVTSAAATYQSSQGYAVGVPAGWNSDFETTYKVDRFWPRIGTGGVMIHRSDNPLGDFGTLDEATIMSMVRVDPVGQTQFTLDPKSVNIDRTGSYSGNAAIVVTYELDDQAGRSRYSSKAYFFSVGESTWSVYEIAPKAERQSMQPSFSEIQESFKVTGMESESSS